MPLVVPGINSVGDNSKTEEWTNKLVGKKIGEISNATVCHLELGQRSYANEMQTFARAELPKESRVIPPGSMVTRDFKPDRCGYPT
jgi:hypothetical protein